MAARHHVRARELGGSQNCKRSAGQKRGCLPCWRTKACEKGCTACRRENQGVLLGFWEPFITTRPAALGTISDNGLTSIEVDKKIWVQNWSLRFWARIIVTWPVLHRRTCSLVVRMIRGSHISTYTVHSNPCRSLYPSNSKLTIYLFPSHGLPKHGIDKYLAAARNRYISNIRGNDIFAFIGHVAVCDQKSTYLEKSRNMIVELQALTALLDRTRTTRMMKSSSSWISKKTNNNDDDNNDKPLLLSLGPAPGSFFADLSSLKRYRWANLPPDLEDVIQEEVCRSGYGTIFDVAINAAGGWVVQFREGKTYKYNGAIPEKLREALSIGQKQKLQIQVSKNLSFHNSNHPEKES